MNIRLLSTILVAILVLNQPLAFGQTSEVSGEGERTGSVTRANPARQKVAMVMFAGLGGAVLGLSTLSFYGEPQEKIGNIWIGLGVGLVGGAALAFAPQKATSTEPSWSQKEQKVFVPLYLAEF